MLPLIILAGPTASGKTDTALALAEHLEAEIINADSMQVYRYFDIGTAKPSPAVRERIPHHLIDILDPEEEFTAFEFKRWALERIRDLRARGKIPLMVGGTGLYLKTLMENYECGVEIPPSVRQAVMAEIRTKGLEAMHAELTRIDPVLAAGIQKNDPQRIERALAVYRATGKPLSAFHAEERAEPYEFEIIFIRLEKEREHLYADINRRVDSMIEAGLAQEVEDILNRGYGPDLKPMQSIGYAQMVQHLRGNVTLDRAVYEIKRDTRHYAKRQVTWFKKVPEALSVSVTQGDTAESIMDKILSILPKVAAFLFLALSLLLSPPVVRAEGTGAYDTAVTLYHEGDLFRAKVKLQELYKNAEEPEVRNRAAYLLARVYLENKNHVQAVPLLEALLSRYSSLEDYLRFDLARALHGAGRDAEALKQLDLLLSKFPRTRVAPSAGRLRAELLTALGQPQKALRQWEQVERWILKGFDSPEYTDQIPDIIVRQIELQKNRKAYSAAYGLTRRLYVHFPEHEAAAHALADMRELERTHGLKPQPLSTHELEKRAGNLLDAARFRQVAKELEAVRKRNGGLSDTMYFHLANAYQGMRQRSQAIRILEEFLKKYPKHRRTAEARFQIGRNLWNLGNPKAAIARFETLLNDRNGSRWTPKAYYYLGRLHEEAGRYDQAIETFQQAASRFPKDENGELSAWRIGWIHFTRGNFAAALKQFQRNAKTLPEGLMVESNLFWMGKSAEALGRRQNARDIFNDLALRFPYTYYGLKAARRLDESTSTSAGKGSTGPVMKAGFTPAASTPSSLGRKLSARESFHFTRARELIELGFYKQARLEMLEAGRTVRKTLKGVLWLSHWYNAARAYADSLKLLYLYKDYKTKTRENELPETFWRNFYPPAYIGPVTTYARQHNIDPLLVESLIRQESMYDTWSLSIAGARGLMQLMPKTGKRLHRGNGGSRNFDAESLHHPDINIRLGVQYMRDLMRRYGNNPTYLLISYNAGPKVLEAWLKRFRNLKDPDVFIESIPYPETRRYVKKVMRNYMMYQLLSSDAGLPSSTNKTF